MRAHVLLAALLASSSAGAVTTHDAPRPFPDPAWLSSNPKPTAEEIAEGQVLEVACDKCASAEVVGMLYRDVLKVPYVVGEGVEADRRMVSVDIRGTNRELLEQATSYLAGLGYVDVMRRGIHLVSLPPLPPPPRPPEVRKPRMIYSVYHPEWRDPDSLARMLAPLFPDGRFSAGGGGAGSEAMASTPIATSGGGYGGGGGGGGGYGGGGGGYGGGSTQPMSAPVETAGGGGGSDSLVFFGTAEDQTRLREVLPQVDTSQAEVMVKASVFEVDTSQDDGSAFNLAVGLLKSKITVGLNSVATPSLASAATGGLSSLAGNFISFQNSNIDAVISALTSDQRFHLVTAPTVRARSGASSSFTVGQQVPVLGSVSYYGGNSSAVQSVDYRSSGVIFTVRPIVRRNTIDLDLHQEISSFVNTTTGVNNTPTLQQRALITSLSVHDGDIICLGGLTQTNNGKTSSGLPSFLSFIGSRDNTHVRTDLLVVLQVVKLNQDDGAATPDELGARRILPRPPALPVIKDQY